MVWYPVAAAVPGFAGHALAVLLARASGTEFSGDFWHGLVARIQSPNEWFWVPALAGLAFAGTSRVLSARCTIHPVQVLRAEATLGLALMGILTISIAAHYGQDAPSLSKEELENLRTQTTTNGTLLLGLVAVTVLIAESLVALGAARLLPGSTQATHLFTHEREADGHPCDAAACRTAVVELACEALARLEDGPPPDPGVLWVTTTADPAVCGAIVDRAVRHVKKASSGTASYPIHIIRSGASATVRHRLLTYVQRPLEQRLTCLGLDPRSCVHLEARTVPNAGARRPLIIDGVEAIIGYAIPGEEPSDAAAHLRVNTARREREPMEVAACAHDFRTWWALLRPRPWGV
jgi:hypothetical protein